MSSLSSSEKSMVIPWWTGLVQGIFSIIIGLLLLTFPAATTVVIVQYVGIYWLVSGIFLVNIFVEIYLIGLDFNRGDPGRFKHPFGCSIARITPHRCLHLTLPLWNYWSGGGIGAIIASIPLKNENRV
jgi:hypothetical protein